MIQQLTKIVNEVIIDSARKEAMDILEASPQKDKEDFIRYYREKKFNICCLHLDHCKGKLEQQGIIIEGDNFKWDFF